MHFRPNFSTCGSPPGGTLAPHSVPKKNQCELNFFRFDNVLLFRGARMDVQLGWRVSFALSIWLLCASSAAQSADSEVQEKPKAIEIVPVLPPSISPDPASATLPIKYWGNSFSLKFHRPSCPFAKAMSAHHVMFFNFRRQAVDSGQVPCRYCLPPNWTTVRASIWHPAEMLKRDSSKPEPNPESVNAPALPTEMPN
ncbi:hypothetical protein BH10CYA1_BH10CYA1_22240 [soil metagenome]